MTYIRHITLATGHTSSIEPGDVSGETLARVGPWLAALVESGQAAPLPVAGLADYSALASVHDGALAMTISGPPMQSGPMDGKCPPLVTMGVAIRSRQAAGLWRLMTGPVMPQAAPGIACPAAPYCAVAIWPTITLAQEAAQWLGDLERCIAWAWVNRAGGNDEH